MTCVCVPVRAAGLGGTESGWRLTEDTGYRQLRSVQRVLDRCAWDAEAGRDELRACVVAHLGAPDRVLVVDETGVLKQWRKSVGVKRQYSGTAGRIENCQVGVCLAHASPKGRARPDRALQLPQKWAEDAARRSATGVPDEVGFQTKPRLALALLVRALDGGGARRTALRLDVPTAPPGAGR